MDPFPRALCVILVLLGVRGFFMDGPCNLYPRYPQTVRIDQDSEAEAKVQDSCHNGTMRWAYPRGHVLLYFPNPSGKSESVCIREWLGGQGFTITDITDGRSAPLGNITRDSYTCTIPSTAGEIVLKVDAPEMLLYVGGVNYIVRRHT